jgi:hypothetical protein
LDATQIEQISLLSGLDKRERARIAQHPDEVEVPEGKRRAREGDLAYEFFVIREGTADVDVARGAARRAATVTATSPMSLVVISGHDLRALSRDMPEVIDKMRSACYDRVSGGAS